VIKGGRFLAAYDAHRPTADLDALARSIADDQDTVVSLVSEIADIPLDDGVDFRTDTATSRIIREQALYSGVRIAMDTAISTAIVKFRIDVNFGDPITPAPGWVTLPPLRAGMEPVRVLGYPLETVLAVAHPGFRLSGVGRNPSRALCVAYGDGLRPLPTEPGRESREWQLSR
jgi:nucleotidyltransferase AbiEii toxin of type IV toxin-antitoxin system